MCQLTLVPFCRKLQDVDQLRVESGGHFNAHTTTKQDQVHPPQVRFPVPFYFILGRDLRDDGVRKIWCHFAEVYAQLTVETFKRENVRGLFLCWSFDCCTVENKEEKLIVETSIAVIYGAVGRVGHVTGQ